MKTPIYTTRLRNTQYIQERLLYIEHILCELTEQFLFLQENNLQRVPEFCFASRVPFEAGLWQTPE